MHRRQVASYLALAVVWGSSFLVLLHVVAAFGWVGAVTFRSLVASAILVALATVTRRRLDFRGAWRQLAVVGSLTVACQLVGLSIATPRIGTASSAILIASIPLFSMLIGSAWGIERITASGRLGLLLGFGGIVLLVGFPSTAASLEFVLGVASAIFGAISAAAGSNYARRHLRGVGVWEQSIGAFVAGGLLTLPLLLVVPVPRPPTLEDLGYLVALAAFCSALAYVLYFRLVAEAGATIATSVEFAVTLVAVLIGAILLGERLTPIQLMGATTIVGGCALVLGLVPGVGRMASASARDKA